MANLTLHSTNEAFEYLPNLVEFKLSDDQTSKSIAWPVQWTSGDCTAASPIASNPPLGPIVTINNDGTGFFQAKCSSTDTGDELQFAVSLFNGATQVYHMPHIPNPFTDADAFHFTCDISFANSWIDCFQQLRFDAALFNQITHWGCWYQG